MVEMTKREFLREYEKQWLDYCSKPVILLSDYINLLREYQIPFEKIKVDVRDFVFLDTKFKHGWILKKMYINKIRSCIFFPTDLIHLVNFDDGIYFYTHAKLKKTNKEILGKVIGELQEQIHNQSYFRIKHRPLPKREHITEQIKQSIIQFQTVLERDKPRGSWFPRLFRSKNANL